MTRRLTTQLGNHPHQEVAWIEGPHVPAKVIDNQRLAENRADNPQSGPGFFQLLKNLLDPTHLRIAFICHGEQFTKVGR